MKRYGEKELRKALVNGATIRENDWFCLDAGYRVMIDGEVAGYIIFDLYLKLKNDGTIEQTGYGYSYREYAASDYAMEQAAKESPFGLAACMASIKSERDVLHMDAAEILARLFHSQEMNGYFFNGTMFDAFERVFPEWPISYEVAREYWNAAYLSEDTDEERIAHCIRTFHNDLEQRQEEAAQAAQEPQEAPEPEPVEEPAKPEEEPQEAPAPDYLRESWPTSNRVESVYYSVASNSPGRVCTAYHCAETVDDLQTYLQQLKRDGETIVGAWRHDRTTGERREFIPETRQEQTDRENRDHCRQIAEDVELVTTGSAYKCPDCGDSFEWHPDAYDDETDRYVCPCCGSSVDADDLEQMGLYDYFSDALDVEYRVGSDKEYRSVRIMVAFGGPNIYIDTASKAVELYWWTDRAEYPLSYDVCDAIDDWAREYWECM